MELTPSWINVKDSVDPYPGAVGDGVTDDTGAIQRAANKLASIGGGILYFPPGIYRMRAETELPSSGDPLTNAAVKIIGSNISLLGDAGRSIILQDGEDRIATIEYVQRSWTVLFCFALASGPGIHTEPHPNPIQGNILVKDLTFYGNISPVAMPGLINSYYASAGSGALLYFSGSSVFPARNIRIENCTFQDANKSEAICPVFIDEISIVNCTFRVQKDFIRGIRVRASSTKNMAPNENEFMNLVDSKYPDLWAEDYADGVAVTQGDRLLVLNQTNSAENGIYTIAKDWTWRLAPELRETDALDIFAEAALEPIFRVEEGRQNRFREFQIQFKPQPFTFFQGKRSNLRFFETVYVATASNEDRELWGVQGFGSGGVLLPGDLVLLKNQANGAENGIYRVSSGFWEKWPTQNLLVRPKMGDFTQFWWLADRYPNFVSASLNDVLGNSPRIARVRVASLSHSSISSNVVDGISLKDGDLALLAGQTDSTANGVYWYDSREQILRRVYHDSLPYLREYHLAGLHAMVEEGTFSGSHFVCRSPLPLNVSNDPDHPSDGASSIVFTRAHAFEWPVVAASRDNENITNIAGLQSIDSVEIKEGDLVLLKGQGIPRENGAYVARKGPWVRASFDHDPDRTSGNFEIWSVYGSQYGAWFRSNGGFGMPDTNEYYAPSYNLPQIFSSGPCGTTRLIGNSCDCDFIGEGTGFGADGFYWIQGKNPIAIANNNIIKNFRFEALQFATFSCVVAGNSFFTRKFLSVVAVNISPPDPAPGTNPVYSTVINGNDVDGAILVKAETLGGTVQYVESDFNITANSVRNCQFDAPVKISPGRRVIIADNHFHKPYRNCIGASSCVTPLIIAGKSGATALRLQTVPTFEHLNSVPSVGGLRSFDRVVIWCRFPFPLPAPLNARQTYFIKVESDSSVSLYFDVQLLKPVVISGDFPLSPDPNQPSALLYYRLDSALSITGNVITNTIGPSNGVIAVGVDQYRRWFNQVVIARNIISAPNTGYSPHISIEQAMAGNSYVSISENVYTDEFDAPSTALIFGSNASYPPLEHLGANITQGNIWNNDSDRNYYSPIANVFHPTNYDPQNGWGVNKSSCLYSAAAGFRFFGKYDPSVPGPVEIFAGAAKQCMLLMEIGFIGAYPQAFSTSGAPKNMTRLLVRTKNGTSRKFVASIDISDVPTSMGGTVYNLQVDSSKVYCQSSTLAALPKNGLGGFFDPGEGLEVIGYTGSKTDGLSGNEAYSDSGPMLIVFITGILQPL